MRTIRNEEKHSKLGKRNEAVNTRRETGEVTD